MSDAELIRAIKKILEKEPASILRSNLVAVLSAAAVGKSADVHSHLNAFMEKQWPEKFPQGHAE